MIESARFAHSLKLALPILVFIWGLSYLLKRGPGYQDVLRDFKDEREVFIADFLENEIDGHFDGSSISNLCAKTKWTPGLVLSCDAPVGGLGSVKNANLNCIRFAIEMGAELILPGIVKRSDQDVSQLIPGNPKGTPKVEPLEFFWDTDHLNQTLSAYCPQMKVYRSRSDLWDVPSLLTSHGISLSGLEVPVVNSSVIADMSLFRERLRKHVETKSPVALRKAPVRFNLELTYYAWPTASDGAAFASNFGRLLRPRTDVRRLAAMALFNLQNRFRLNLDPRSGIQRESFVGLHLRTEKDADANYPTYAEQAAYSLDYVTRSKSPVAFLATGTAKDHIVAFAARAKDFNVTVVTKHELLDAGGLAALDDLSYDQRALVDYEIMLRAGLVAGPAQSSFAWNLAMRRANAYGNVGNATSANAKAQWQDRYSTIFGHSEHGSAIQATIWP